MLARSRTGATAKTYYTGGSIPLSASITLRCDSRAHLPIKMGDVTQIKRTPSTTEDALCPPCDAPPSNMRPNLINMKCRYFFSFSGCLRDDCRFLHDEKPEDVVFLDGNETPRYRNQSYVAPGPRADVKIFIGNLPPGTMPSFVIDLASPFGEIKKCDVLKSTLRNGRCPAVLYMTSDAQANAAIDAINAYTDRDGQRAYARKEYSRPDAEIRPTRLKTLICGTKTATAQIKNRTQSAKPPSSQLPPPPQLPSSQPVEFFKGTVKPVKKDGNCLFSAVELGDKSTVRKVTVDWIESHLDDKFWGGYTYRSYIEEEKQVKAESYIANMRNTGVWGGLPELYALSTLAGVRLRVFEEVTTGVFKLIASELFEGEFAETRDVCLRSHHYDTLSDVWPLTDKEVRALPTRNAKATAVKTVPNAAEAKPSSGANKIGKKASKPVLNNERDNDGYRPASKTRRVEQSLHVPIQLSSTFALLYDLPEDWEDAFEPDDPDDAPSDDPDDAPSVDPEVAELNPISQSPVLAFMPSLCGVTSPTSIISGDWTGANKSRKERVMSPSDFKMPPPAKAASLSDGWHILKGKHTCYSDS